MKKFLSLVLALVMTMSLVTISAGAKDFDDNGDIDYKEAVDVISALGIVDGYSDSSFRPDGSLTRGAAAKIICNLILGPTTASALSASTAPFKDVPTTNVFAGYITYCAQRGIISGYGDGTFRPTGTLTGNAFMKMLLGALGYDSSIEGYTGSNWQVNVTKQAIGIGLEDGNDEFVGSKAVTRQEAALYSFNMLQATMVEYNAKTTVNVNGATVTIAGDKAQDKYWGTGKNNDGNIKDDDFVQFAEQYFGDLKLKDGTDTFARPANVWTLKGTEIGTYTRDADVTYTAGVEAGEIYSDLGLADSIVKDKVTVYVDGEEEDHAVAIRRGSDTDIEDAHNGVLTQVWYDDEAETVLITHINTYVGTVVKSVSASGSRDAYVVVAPEGSAPKSAPVGISGNEEFETTESFEDDQYVLYTYSQDSGEIESVTAAEDASGEVTRAENANTNVQDKAALTVDGTRYTASWKVAGEDLGDISVNEEYIVYLDSYGYIIYVEQVDEIGDYALVLMTANRGSFIGNKAILVFTDGTSDIVDTDKNYSAEAGFPDTTGDAPVIVTYRVDEDGEYTLRAVDTGKADYDSDSTRFSLENDKAGIKVDTATINGVPVNTVTANSATAFVVRDPSNADLEDDVDWTAYTGIKNAPTLAANVDGGDDDVGVYYYCRNGRMVTVMFIVPEEDVKIEDGVQNNLFLSKESVSNLIHDKDGDYFEYDAVDNNELVTVKVSENVTVDGNNISQAGYSSYSAAVKATLGGLYAGYSTDKYGVITDLETFDKNYDTNSNDLQVLQVATGIDRISREYTVILDTATPPTAIVGNVHPAVGSGDYVITVDEDATYYYVDEDGDISESSYNGIVVDNDDKVYAVIDDNMVQMLVIQEVNPTYQYGVEIIPDTGDTYDQFEVNGRNLTAGKNVLEAGDRGDDVYFTVEPENDFEIKSVSGAVSLGNGEYVVRNVKSLVTVTVDVDPISAEQMPVIVWYSTDGTSAGSLNQYEIVYVDEPANGIMATVKMSDLAQVPTGYYLNDSDKPVRFNTENTPEIYVKVAKLTVAISMDDTLSGRTNPKIAVNGGAAATDGTVTPADDGYNVTVVFTDGNGVNWNGYADTNHIRLNATNVEVSAPTFSNISTSGFTMSFTISNVQQGAAVEIDYEPSGF